MLVRRFRRRRNLFLENLALRQQPVALKRQGLETVVRASIDKLALAKTLNLRPQQKMILAEWVGSRDPGWKCGFGVMAKSHPATQCRRSTRKSSPPTCSIRPGESGGKISCSYWPQVQERLFLVVRSRLRTTERPTLRQVFGYQITNIAFAFRRDEVVVPIPSNGT
jgi:hypothetical protein